jgi:hypothetical protein
LGSEVDKAMVDRMRTEQGPEIAMATARGAFVTLAGAIEQAQGKPALETLLREIADGGAGG